MNLVTVTQHSTYDLLSSFWKHHPVADQQGESLACETIAFQEKFNCDFVKLMPAGSWQAACYGVIDTWENDLLGRRTITNTVIKTPDDWLNLPDFSKSTPALMQEIVRACVLVHERISSEIPILCTLFCPITQAVQLAGLPVFMEHIKTHPAFVLAGLKQITKNTLPAIKAFKKAGADGVFYATQHMRAGALPKAVYDQFGLVFDTECLNACADFQFNIFHIHGENIYFSFDGLPKNCIIHYEDLSNNPTADDFYAICALPLSLGIPVSIMLAQLSEQQIERFLRNHLNKNPCGKLILAGCVLPLDFPDERLKKWLNCLKTIKNDVRFPRPNHNRISIF